MVEIISKKPLCVSLGFHVGKRVENAEEVSVDQKGVCIGKRAEIVHCDNLGDNFRVGLGLIESAGEKLNVNLYRNVLVDEKRELRRLITPAALYCVDGNERSLTALRTAFTKALANASLLVALSMERTS